MTLPWQVLQWWGTGSWMDSLERWGRGVYVREQQECTEHRVGMRDPTESWWVRIEEQTYISNTALGVCYRLPAQDKCGLNLLQKAGSSLAFTSPCPHGELWPHCYQLEGKHSMAWAIQEAPGDHLPIPDPAGGGTNEERDSTGIHKRKVLLGCVKAEVTMR